MSSDSLINNVNYNVIMDRNISVLSNQSTIPPEELSYVINIIDAEIYVPNSNVYIPDVENENDNILLNLLKMKIIVIKLTALTLVVLLLVLWVCFYM